MPQVTFRTSSKVKRLKVKVTKTLNAVTENQSYLREREALQAASHHFQGAGHIVSAALQAAQLVDTLDDLFCTKIV